jgi:hypothetical protein
MEACFVGLFCVARVGDVSCYEDLREGSVGDL